MSGSTLRTGPRRGFSVLYKLLGIVSLCLLSTVVVAVLGIWQMARVGSEIEAVAEQDMPLTELVNRVTVSQLEQAVLLERIMRMSGLTGETTAEELRQAEATFEEMSQTVDQQIREGEKLAEEAATHAQTAEGKAEFDEVLVALQHIEREHQAYDDQAAEIFKLAHEGRRDEAIQRVSGIEAEEAELDHAFEALQKQINAFTLRAVQTVEEHEKTAILQITMISIVSALAGFGLAIWFVRAGVARPLAQVVNALGRLADGDTTVEVAVRSRDEIGQVAEAFVVFKQKTLELKRLEEERAEEEERQRAEKRRQMLALADSFESTVGGVVDTVSAAANELQATAQSMTAIAGRTKGLSVTVAGASEEASMNVQTVATASEELSTSISEIARQIAETTKVSRDAVGDADRASLSVTGLAEAAQKIGAVVSLIQDIAEQTNLLALNATIEAARAGEMGKGFAVVAGEVKTLATQTAKATQEIAQQVETMQSATGGTVGAIEAIVTIIKRISDNAQGIAAAVEEQNAATREISRNVQEAAVGTEAVASNIVGVREATEQTGTAANDVLEASGQLSRQSELLRGEVGRFLAGLRAA